MKIMGWGSQDVAVNGVSAVFTGVSAVFTGVYDRLRAESAMERVKVRERCARRH